MKATYKLTDPDSVEATMTITMTLGNWKKLRDKLAAQPNAMSYPNFKLRDVIDDLVKKAQERFETEGDIE